ncbi:YqjF family protein [Tamlana flava]|uniref:YqjF family protein n=1 Tax=Tamlana flava TaxID=3158572 RepID=UPI00351ADE7E
MKAKEILKQKEHRPFDFPENSWKFYQEWNKGIFLHWEVNPELVKPHLPKGMELDTIDGKTWVSLVAFDMNHIGIRSILKIPRVSDFHEINLRIYVIYKGKPGVYFLSMEGSKRSSCKVLRTLSKFPYRFSKIKRTDFSYTSKNKKFDDLFHIEFELGNTIETRSKTDVWLTERYVVFQDYSKNIAEYNVHHLEWPLQDINLKKLDVNYPRFSDLMNNKPDKIHYSKGVQVLAWNKIRHRI